MAVIIIDNGSQYTHLIKRNCRDLGYHAEIINNKNDYQDAKIQIDSAEKIILSGGPSSVYVGDNGIAGAIVTDIETGKIKQPLLGICFGHQLLAYMLGGKVEKGASAEYGVTKITVDEEDLILKGVKKEFKAWASHYDEVKALPKDFIALAHSETCRFEAMRHKTQNIFGVQFHPEVWHTEDGERILKNFLSIEL